MKSSDEMFQALPWQRFNQIVLGLFTLMGLVLLWVLVTGSKVIEEPTPAKCLLLVIIIPVVIYKCVGLWDLFVFQASCKSTPEGFSKRTLLHGRPEVHWSDVTCVTTLTFKCYGNRAYSGVLILKTKLNQEIEIHIHRYNKKKQLLLQILSCVPETCTIDPLVRDYESSLTPYN